MFLLKEVQILFVLCFMFDMLSSYLVVMSLVVCTGETDYPPRLAAEMIY